MKQITGRDGKPYVFGLDHGEYGEYIFEQFEQLDQGEECLRLSGIVAGPSSGCNPDDEFVFRFRPRIKAKLGTRQAS
jgi:hypothetical protein